MRDDREGPALSYLFLYRHVFLSSGRGLVDPQLRTLLVVAYQHDGIGRPVESHARRNPQPVLPPAHVRFVSDDPYGAITIHQARRRHNRHRPLGQARPARSAPSPATPTSASGTPEAPRAPTARRPQPRLLRPLRRVRRPRLRSDPRVHRRDLNANEVAVHPACDDDGYRSTIAVDTADISASSAVQPTSSSGGSMLRRAAAIE